MRIIMKQSSQRRKTARMIRHPFTVLLTSCATLMQDSLKPLLIDASWAYSNPPRWTPCSVTVCVHHRMGCKKLHRTQCCVYVGPYALVTVVRGAILCSTVSRSVHLRARSSSVWIVVAHIMCHVTQPVSVYFEHQNIQYRTRYKKCSVIGCHHQQHWDGWDDYIFRHSRKFRCKSFAQQRD